MRPVPGAGRYAAWQALVGTWFWLPVFFLYFTGELGLDGALLLEAVYYVAVVVTEVPSGYISDRLGRKTTLVLASIWFVVAYAAFWVGGSLPVLVVGQVFLALAISFRSGTDASYHLELLTEAGAGGEFGAREGRLVRLTLLVGALGAVAGGLAGTFSLRSAYLLCMGSSVAALAVAIFLHSVGTPGEKSAAGPADQLRACWVAAARRPTAGRVPLRWLFGVAVLAVVLAHVPYQLYQPYLDLLSLDTAVLPTPLVSGGHTAVALLFAAPVAGWSGHAARRFGIRGTLLGALAGQLLIIGVIAVAVHPIIAGLLVLRGVPGALLRPTLDAAVAPQVRAGLRATYLSLQSLGGRLAYAFALAAMSLVAASGATEAGLRTLAAAVLGVGVVGWIILASSGRGGQHRTDSSLEGRP